jgi:hypothetical protein
MIESLDDAIAYSETLADEDDPPLSRPGLTPVEIAEVRERYPDIPPSYLDCIAEVQVLDRWIDGIRLSPAGGGENERSFADALQYTNDYHHLEEAMAELGLLEVASTHADSLCVQRGGDGRVIWVDWRAHDERPYDFVVRELAPSFRDFIVMVARFDAEVEAAENEDAVDEIGRGIDLSDEQRENVPLFFS